MPISSFSQISREWIAVAVSTNPANISSFHITRQFDTGVSQIAFLKIEYHLSEADLPQSVAVKIARDSPLKEFSGFGKQEVAFYCRIAPQIAADCFAKCYSACFDENSRLYNIVLQDLSEYFFQTEYPVPPSIPRSQMAIECLAKIHSACWNNQRLLDLVRQSTVIDFTDYSDYSNFIKTYRSFVNFMGDRFLSYRRQIIEDVIQHWYKLAQRFQAYKGLTLAHNDAHFWNFLYPIGSGIDAKLIDWQFYGVGIAARDLAYMIALHLFPNRRREYEMELLKYYHDSLQRAGITNYGFDELLLDYRFSIIESLVIPIKMWRLGIRATIWYNHIERIFTAYDDLNCYDLLRGS